MLEINVALDTTAFTADTDSAIRSDVIPAVAERLNRFAYAARDAVREAMRKDFDRPSPFTIDGVRVFPARAKGTGDLDVVVLITDTVAGYLELEINPGTRRVGMPGTTKLGPLVPGATAPRDSFGNLPRGYVEQVLREPNVAWIHLRRDAPPGARTSQSGAAPGGPRDDLHGDALRHAAARLLRHRRRDAGGIVPRRRIRTHLRGVRDVTYAPQTVNSGMADRNAVRSGLLRVGSPPPLGLLHTTAGFHVAPASNEIWTIPLS